MRRNFFDNSKERTYFESIVKRNPITDEAFYHEHYMNSRITLDTCSRVRRVLCKQLRMCNTLPADNVATVFDDIDIAEICHELAQEFAVDFTNADIQGIDGTVDSLIRLIQRRI